MTQRSPTESRYFLRDKFQCVFQSAGVKFGKFLLLSLAQNTTGQIKPISDFECRSRFGDPPGQWLNIVPWLKAQGFTGEPVLQRTALLIIAIINAKCHKMHKNKATSKKASQHS